MKDKKELIPNWVIYTIIVVMFVGYIGWIISDVYYQDLVRKTQVTKLDKELVELLESKVLPREFCKEKVFPNGYFSSVPIGVNCYNNTGNINTNQHFGLTEYFEWLNERYPPKNKGE